MTILLLDIGNTERGCFDCDMDQQSQKCRAGFIRSPLTVITRNNIKYKRSKACIQAAHVISCSSCYLRKGLSVHNYCRKHRFREEAEDECIKRGYRDWLPHSHDTRMKDLREEI